MNERQWFYLVGTQRHGPVPENQLIVLFSQGNLSPDTQIWTDGLPGWLRASSHETFANKIEEASVSPVVTRFSSPIEDSGELSGSSQSGLVTNIESSSGAALATFSIKGERVSKPQGHRFNANRTITIDHACTICNERFQLSEGIVKCSRCHSYYHADCWDINQGCTNATCKTTSDSPVQNEKPCPICSKPVKIDALKCKYCGNFVDAAMRREEIAASKGTAPGAIASLVTGIIGLFLFGFILGWIAISNGRSAIRKIEADPDYSGRGLATAGIILGVVDIGFWVLILIARL